jgi:hypothetical protein
MIAVGVTRRRRTSLVQRRPLPAAARSRQPFPAQRAQHFPARFAAPHAPAAGRVPPGVFVQHRADFVGGHPVVAGGHQRAVRDSLAFGQPSRAGRGNGK